MVLFRKLSVIPCIQNHNSLIFLPHHGEYFVVPVDPIKNCIEIGTQFLRTDLFHVIPPFLPTTTRISHKKRIVPGSVRDKSFSYVKSL